MKKILGIVCALMCASVPVFAESNVNIMIDHAPVTFENSSAYIDALGNIMLPIRDVSEYLGYTVDWNDEEKAVYVYNDTTNIVLYTTDMSYTLNGNNSEIDIPITNIDGTTYMEFVDLISTMDGYMAQYIQEDSVVNIFKGDEYTVTAEGVKDWKGDIISFEELYERGLSESYIESMREEVLQLQNQ